MAKTYFYGQKNRVRISHPIFVAVKNDRVHLLN